MKRMMIPLALLIAMSGCTTRTRGHRAGMTAREWNGHSREIVPGGRIRVGMPTRVVYPETEGLRRIRAGLPRRNIYWNLKTTR